MDADEGGHAGTGNSKQRHVTALNHRTQRDEMVTQQTTCSGPSPIGAPTMEEWPLVLTRRQAGQMCKISVQTFDAWVRKGVLPGPISGTRRWSRIAIERALACDPVVPTPDLDQSAFEQWKRTRAH